MARNKDKPTPYEKRGKDGPDDRAVAGAMIDCIMGVPVDPAHGFPQEQVSTLREEIEEMMARGVMVEIPTSIDDFDPDEFRED